MPIVKLVGGPYDGETVEVTAAARAIDVHRDDGSFASYAPSEAGTWKYAGSSRPMRAETARGGACSPDNGGVTALSR